MALYMLSSASYNGDKEDYGDCFLIINNNQALIYDCGSEEHAKRVEKLLKDNNVVNVTAVLSHNDDDHYVGFKYLAERNIIDGLITIDIKSHRDDILRLINDGRKTDNSISTQIENLYDNISEINNEVSVYDIYTCSYLLPCFAKFEGPKYEYFISSAAQGCNSLKGDRFGNTSFTNAPSIQLTVAFGNNKVLLTGDCAADSIPESIELTTYSHIQLPHHGNPDMAKAIFDRVDNERFNNKIEYLVSDNKGNASGGSDSLMTKGRNVKNSNEADYVINDTYSVESIQLPKQRLGQ